jgi:hypothetical protein
MQAPAIFSMLVCEYVFLYRCVDDVCGILLMVCFMCSRVCVLMAVLMSWRRICCAGVLVRCFDGSMCWWLDRLMGWCFDDCVDVLMCWCVDDFVDVLMHWWSVLMCWWVDDCDEVHWCADGLMGWWLVLMCFCLHVMMTVLMHLMFVAVCVDVFDGLMSWCLEMVHAAMLMCWWVEVLMVDGRLMSWCVDGRLMCWWLTGWCVDVKCWWVTVDVLVCWRVVVLMCGCVVVSLGWWVDDVGLVVDELMC